MVSEMCIRDRSTTAIITSATVYQHHYYLCYHLQLPLLPVLPSTTTTSTSATISNRHLYPHFSGLYLLTLPNLVLTSNDSLMGLVSVQAGSSR